MGKYQPHPPSPRRRPLDVGEGVLELDELGGADQFGDPAIEIDGGLEALAADLLVRDLVVTLIGVGADFGEVEVVIDVLEDLAGDVFLGEVHALVADVVDVVLDLVPPLQGEDDRPGYVADVDESALESPL